MLRLFRALSLYHGSALTWRTAWRLARTGRKYNVVRRGDFLYIEPRIGA